MKNFHTPSPLQSSPLQSSLFPSLLLALVITPIAALAPLPAAHAGGRQCLAEVTAAAAQSRVDLLVQEAVDLASKQQPITGKLAEIQTSVGLESQTYVGSEGECLIERRVTAEVAEMRARAQRYLVHANDVRALQREIVLSRLERQVNVLKQRWSQGDHAEGLLQKAIETLESTAFDWFDALPVISVRQRLQDAIFAIQQSANDRTDVVHRHQDFLRELYEARYQSAVSTLQEHIESGKASRADFARLEGLAQAFEALKKRLTPYACRG
jgi:hypothetical protein